MANSMMPMTATTMIKQRNTNHTDNKHQHCYRHLSIPRSTLQTSFTINCKHSCTPTSIQLLSRSQLKCESSYHLLIGC